MDYNLILNKMARKYRNRPIRYFADKNLSLSCADLAQHSAVIAAWLRKRGIEKGDRIGIWMGNVPEFLLTFAAGLRLGAVLVPINVYATMEEITRICQKSKCRILVVDYDNPKICKRVGKELYIEGTECVGLTENCAKNQIRFPAGTEAESTLEQSFRCEIGIKDDVVINFTSGSTGEHKGIRKSIRSFFGKNGFPGYFVGLFDLMREMKMTVFNICPWYHTTGIYLVMILMSGGVFTEITMEKYNPSDALKYMEQYSPKIWIGTSTMLYRCCIAEQEFDRRIKIPEITLSAGEALSHHIIETLSMQDNARMLISIYGLTETGIVASAVYQFRRLPLYLHIAMGFMQRKNWIGEIQTEEDALEQTRGQFLGKIKKDTRVDIFDIVTKAKLQDGEQGEICVCTSMHPNGFTRKKESNVFLKSENCWYIRTGDFGFKKKDQLYLTGRIKNLIIRSGENIIPKDIECRIEDFHGVEDVVACGIPDSRYGEEICACLEVGECEVDLDRLKEKLLDELPKYMMPKWFLFWHKFPVNSSNKKDIKKIRDEAIERIRTLETDIIKRNI